MKPLTHTACGTIAGDVSTDRSVGCFKGIPYAQPPVGALRWCPPRPVQPWKGVRQATEFGPAAPQPPIPPHSLVYGHEGRMSEDCLYLNVWTGSTDQTERRPVIVWFHLGGFMMGWGGAPIYDGTELARAGAVVVTVNYRLGRFGFLAHPELSEEAASGVSGNYGLMDQIAALTWVRDNIAAFGGDPDCVTIYGVSAGGFSVSALMASPLAKGLFHRAIGGSGGAFSPTSDSSEAGDFLQTIDAAEALGAEVMARVGAKTAADMRALSTDAILGAKGTLEFWRARRGLLDTTYPIIDGYVLPASPYEIFSARRHNDVPLITGSNTHESTIVPFNEDTETWLEDTRALFGPAFERFSALFPAGPSGLTARSSMAANADRLFSWQNWTWARQQAAHGTSPVFYYNFTHEPPVPPDSVAEQGLVARVGAFHSAELPYVFRNLAARGWPWSEEDRQLSRTMSAYWLNFARTGNPNGGTLPEWRRFDLVDKAMMDFGAIAVPSSAPPSERFAFWDEFYASRRPSSEQTRSPVAESCATSKTRIGV